MTSLEIPTPHPFVANVIRRRAGSAASARAVAAAARRAYEDLAAVLDPIISEAGVDALIAQAVHLTKRQYRADLEKGEWPADPSGVWLKRHDPAVVLRVATAILSTFAALLASLIGEPLATRYLRKAWSDAASGQTRNTDERQRPDSLSGFEPGPARTVREDSGESLFGTVPRSPAGQPDEVETTR